MAHTITTTPITALLPGDVIVRDQFGDPDRAGYIMDIYIGDQGVSVTFSTARSNGSYHESFVVEEDVEAIWNS